LISLEELNRLMDASIKDPRKEPEFFRALLETTLYAHAPLNDNSERLRLVMFTSPADHALTVPVFTDAAKAEFAARGKVRIVSMPGRLLFEITQGASLTINPNDNWCTLYPEEISELLATGTVAPIQHDQYKAGEATCFKLSKIPPSLVKALRKSLPKIRSVKVAYVAGVKWRSADRPDSLVIVLGGGANSAEREVRATATVLHALFERLNQPVEMLHFDSAQAKPSWIHQVGLKPVYRRHSGQPAPTSRYN
jgi:hypothetical protein